MTEGSVFDTKRMNQKVAVSSTAGALSTSQHDNSEIDVSIFEVSDTRIPGFYHLCVDWSSISPLVL